MEYRTTISYEPSHILKIIIVDKLLDNYPLSSPDYKIS